MSLSPVIPNSSTLNKTIYAFDIDDTISDPSHRLCYINTKPKNWTAFNEALVFDPEISQVSDIAKWVAKCPDTVLIYTTARPRCCEVQTVKWLREKKLDFHENLYMRDHGDYRPDYLVKKDMLESIKQDYGRYPHIWIDDKKPVLDMLLDHGVFAVNSYFYRNDNACA